jgi:guanosine-3',5'-bis(diphosphate) 3'-pyrophosphohydrolase
MTAPVLADIIPGWDLSDDSLTERLDPELLARAYRLLGEGARGADTEERRSVRHALCRGRQDPRRPALDSATVASGLIHDVVEDTAFTVEDVEREFGREIAQIVDGLTKIGHLPLASREDRQVESYRKLLLSVAKDVRVILVKLADRLHNMRTLEWMPEEKRQRIALETRDLYAPMAHRFGLASVKGSWRTCRSSGSSPRSIAPREAHRQQARGARGNSSRDDRSRWSGSSVRRGSW